MVLKKINGNSTNAQNISEVSQTIPILRNSLKLLTFDA